MAKKPVTPSRWVAALALHEFRCHQVLRLETGPAPVILTGANGAGKTSCLESLSFFAPGRGMLQTLPAMAARHQGHGGWGASLLLARKEGAETRLGTGLAALEKTHPQTQSRRRLLRIDGKPARNAGAFSHYIRPLWLTPSMERLMDKTQSPRRALLDRLALALEPTHAQSVQRARRARAQRRRFLLDGRRDANWLAATERDLASAALTLTRTRLKSAAHFNRNLRETGFALKITLEGGLADYAAQKPEIGEEALRVFLQKTRQQGRFDGLPPAKLQFLHPSGRDAALCSTGERKLMLAALLLAAARAVKQSGGEVLLLLDDVAAHLDAAHRARFFSALSDLAVQFWATGSDSALFAPLEGEAQFIHLPLLD